MLRRLLPPLVGLTLTLCVVAAGDDWRPPAAPKPKPVSLKFDKVSPKQALAELTRQTGVAVADRLGGPGESFAVDLPKSTFWPALDAIARSARARIDLYPRDGPLALVPRPAGYVEPPVSYSGLFRTSVKRVTASRHFDTGASTCSAALEVAWEPTLEPLLLDTSPRTLTVRDDKGRELPARREERVTASIDRRYALEFDVPLPPVPRSVERLGLLEGRLAAVVPDKVVTFVFDSLERAAESAAGSPLRGQTRDGVVCRISKVQRAKLQPAGERLTVEVALEYPAGGVQLESHQSRVVNNEMVLESPDGSKRLTTADYNVESPSERRAVVSYHFIDENGGKRGRAADWKVRYRTPAALVEVPLAFSFKDVPLP